MSPFSNKTGDLREQIIGLGENSFHKSFYPELQKRLNELEALYSSQKALLDAIPDELITANEHGDILQHRARRILGGEGWAAGLQANLRDYLPDYLFQMMREQMAQAKQLHAMQVFEYEIPGENGVGYYEARIVAIHDDSFLIIIRDVTDRVLLQNELHTMATTDHLTGLYNRRYFEEAITGHVHSHNPISVVICDIDGLKFINDTFGHPKGDEVLKAASFILRSCFQKNVVIARIGGDEFGVFLHGLTNAEVDAACAAVNDRIDEFNRSTLELQIGMSIGYSHCASGDCDVRGMYREADNNMYKKKLLTAQSNRSALVVTLEKALEARDFITEGHAERMEKLVVHMGKRLGFSDLVINDLRLLAHFHDIGKVGISDTILFKPGKLNRQEYEIMQKHCEIGHKIASSTGDLNHIAHLILKHHEKWDGTGYPYGLKGLEIPIECRLLGVVDAYDAMSNDRPYRKAMPQDQVLDELRRNSGLQFDPDMVDALVDIVTSGRIAALYP